MLGSLPSQLSLQRQEYYGNPQNAFWQIMGELVSAGPELPYGERVRRLLEMRIAVWDVLESSIRPGSMDSAIDITHARANDFAAFLDVHEAVASVCFNGQKAAQLFRRMVLPAIPDRADGLRFVALPSTSPAHAAMTFQDKLQRWRIVGEALH